MTPAHDHFATVKAAVHSTLKARLRKQVKARRDALDATARAILSARITARVLELDSYRAAKSVLAYMAFGSEFDTRALLDHTLAQGKKLLLPRVKRGSRSLALHVVKDLALDLQPGVWSILEPRAETPWQEHALDIDWILVPGLAFTANGERLGYGAGYYDRLIASCVHKPALVAAAFSTQVVNAVPCSPTDMRVDYVVTEETIYGAPLHRRGGKTQR